MPGRKSLILMTTQSTFIATDPKFPRQNEFMYLSLFNTLADEALRAGIVIHTLDMKGSSLWTLRPNEKYLPLSKKTGGIIVDNSNFFVNGIGPAEEELKGYYLLAYAPPANTFVNKGPGLYHRIQIRVKRSRSTVRSRDGFFGLTNTSNPPSIPSKNLLREAVFSPFVYNDLSVSLASGYAHVPKPGYFIRSWLHSDAKDLTFIDENDGGHSLSLEVVALTADSDGNIQDFRSMEYTFYVKNENLPEARKNGVNFDVYLPVKKPGNYYIRAAIRDRASGKIGSAYQFLQIPDLRKGRLSVSSIFIVNSGEDLSPVKSGDIERKPSPYSALKWQEAVESPALRNYLPGEGFDYIAIIYNAKSSKGLEPKLESQLTLYKEGKEYFKGNLDAVDLRGADDLARIPIAKRLIFGKGMDEGQYVMELLVTDKQAGKKPRTAVQAIDFEIRKGPEQEENSPSALH